MFDVLDAKTESRNPPSSMRRRSRALANNKYFAVFFAIITIWILFADDFRRACLPTSADPVLNILSIVCMICFAFEIVVHSLGTREYFGSFFFWLDILATTSMVMDIQAVRDAILASSGGSESLESTTLARATRMSRVGTRAGRIASVRPAPCIPLHPAWNRLLRHQHPKCTQSMPA